ncbi:MAG TPA: NAD(P)/FAD-dependent oxidoreductase [Haliangiales bacterium]|nr:NAD(P)/FAD-dependent oxidoreductase [Haliangiales bacterium]
MIDYDVVIAGAGPGGASLAVALARRLPGMRTLVVERARFPRAKPCGGGLTGHATEAMAAIGLALDVPAVPAPGARVRFGAFEREVRLPRPVNVVRREEFDASLVAAARAAGVDICEGEGVRGFDVDAGGVTVRTARRTFRAAALVGADGAASVVRRRLVRREPTPIRLFRAEVAAPPDWVGRDDMVYDFSLFGEGLAGYLWVFPVPGDRLNVGLMHYPSDRLGGAQLTELLRRGLRAHGIELGGEARGWPAWAYRGRAAVSAPRLLLVGDAAGIDALTGEGIAVAMEHALVAADELAAAFARGDFRFRGYRRALRRAVVGRELVLDGRLARLLYGRGGWRRWLPLVLFDRDMLELYAARVAGGLVLADQRRRLVGALLRHAFRYRSRARRLAQLG